MSGESESTKEQILGLYIVGLLAVLVAFKLSSKLDPAADSFFMVVIACWGTYSFLMVFGYSNITRIFESPTSKAKYERFANLLKDMAQVDLVMSFGISVIFFVWYFWAALLFILFLLAVFLGIYYLARALWKRWKKKNQSPDFEHVPK